MAKSIMANSEEGFSSPDEEGDVLAVWDFFVVHVGDLEGGDGRQRGRKPGPRARTSPEAPRTP